MKKFLTSIIVLIAVLSLVACGNNGGGNNNGDILSVDQIDTSKKIDIPFYHAMGDANEKVMQSIADKFSVDMKKQYGVDVTVTFTSQGNYDTLRKTIAAAISAGDQPVIAQTYPDHVSLYLEGEAVRELDSYVSHADYGLEGTEADSYGYVDSYWAEGRIYDKDKTLYSIPFNKSTEVVFYNVELFEKYSWEAPKTWEDVKEICENWKNTTEYQNIVKANKKTAGMGIDSEANFFITLIQQWGGEYTGFDANGKGVYLFNNQTTKDALSWLVNEFNEGNLATATHFGTDYCSDAFTAQQIPMTIGSSAGASYNINKAGEFTTGVAPYPQMDGAAEDEKFVIQQGTNVTLFKCEDKQQELFGWLFIKYLTNYESALEWTLKTAYYPTRKDVIASKEYQEYVSQMVKDANGNEKFIYDPIKEVCKVGLIDQAAYYYTSVAFPGTAKAREEAELIIQEILYNQTEYTVEKALNDAIKALLNN